MGIENAERDAERGFGGTSDDDLRGGYGDQDNERVASIPIEEVEMSELNQTYEVGMSESSRIDEAKRIIGQSRNTRPDPEWIGIAV